MNFDLLRQSINLNATEPPSLYNTMNIIRALFLDVEEATMGALSQCPFGDERLPLQMIWLSDELLRIYEDNTDALQRNRGELDSIMQELRTVRDELEELADCTAQLPGKKQEYRELTKQLTAARTAKKTYDDTQLKITEARKQLAELQQFDAVQAEAALRALEGEVLELRTQKEQLKQDIAKYNGEKTTLNDTIRGLQNKDKQVLQPELMRLNKLKTELKQKQTETNRQISGLQVETQQLETALRTLQDQLPGTEQEKSNAQKRVDDYQRDVLDPVQKKLDALLAKEDELKKQKENAERDISNQSTTQLNLTLEIGKKKQQYENAKKAYRDALAREKTLQDELKQVGDNLELKQKAVEKLENVDLPNAKQLLKEETRRADALARQINDANTEYGKKSDAINRMNAQLPGLKTTLENLRVSYTALTASYNATNEEIEELERKIKDLNEKNDQDRLTQYRTQLEEDFQKLEDLGKECDDLDQEIGEQKNKLKDKTATRDRLLATKKKQEQGLIAINELLKELAPCTSPDYLLKAQKTEQQYQMLSELQKKLTTSISDVREHILHAGNICTDEMDLLKELDKYLSQAAVYSRNLYQDLIDAAQKLADHIKEDES